MSSDEDWPGVGSAIRERMAELKMTTACLARETGLSETTIRYISRPGQRANRSTLVAISAVLGWRYDYLVNILLRKPQENTPVKRAIGESLSLIDAKLNAIMMQNDTLQARIIN